MLASALDTIIDMKNLVTGNLIKNIAERIFPFNYSVSGRDSEQALAVYREFADFKVHSFESGNSLRGWTIPSGWQAHKALIKHNGSIIYDALAGGPLGCAYLSPSYKGIVNKDELIRHLAYRQDLPEAVVYDWTRLYRPADRGTWGLSIPWKDILEFPEKDLEVDIVTKMYPSKMHVLDLRIQGTVDDEIIINAHNCHPYQANDDISGCAVGIALFKYKLQCKKNYYTYRLLIAPELYGPMFWLEKIKHTKISLKSAILLKSVGNDSPIKIQNSYTGDSEIDRFAKTATLSRINWLEDTKFYPYRSYYGNDETVFEAPGYQIPSITLTRFPFNEYHTNLDTPEKLNLHRLMECYEMLATIIDIAETNKQASLVEPGLFCLSNPRYNLYQKAPEPGISNDGNSIDEKKWNLLMNCLPRDLSAGLSVVDISLKYQIEYKLVLNYIEKWQLSGLVDLQRKCL